MQIPTQIERVKPARRRLSSILLSLTLHVSLLALTVLLGSLVRRQTVVPAPVQALALLNVAGGSHAIRISLPPSDFSAHTRTPTHDLEASHKTILPVEEDHPKTTGGGTPKTPHSGDGAGQALSGNGSDNDDVHPAFPTYSPRPPVRDRSLLPQSEVKIVVDVDLDALGQVTRETLVKGLGTRLDQIVLETVKTWRFQPATVNGKAVASQDELIFPFNPSYPISDS